MTRGPFGDIPKEADPAADAAMHPALRGVSTGNGAGVTGQNNSDGAGVVGKSDNGDGIYGKGGTNGVHGESTKAEHSGVWANNSGGGMGVAGTSDANGGIGVYGRGQRLAGKFDGSMEVSGNVWVTGDVVLTGNAADCAEDFDIVGLEKIEPGTVMVIDLEEALRECDRAYDKRVAGVISGAGSYKPGLILNKQESSKNRMPIALMGKVYCKVDASYGAIEIGDLITTSPTLGHGMKADDPLKAFGAVIGKALHSLDEGQGLIPILIALQ